MGAIRLGVLATFMSDPMISGFTTGSAVLVVISQLPHIFGLKVPPMSSPLTAPKVSYKYTLPQFDDYMTYRMSDWLINDCYSFLQKVIYMLEHIASSNGGAIITGVLCLLILIGLRQVNDRFKSKLPVPIPGELLVVCCLCFFFLSKSSTVNMYNVQFSMRSDVGIQRQLLWVHNWPYPPHSPILVWKVCHTARNSMAPAFCK